MTKTQPPRDEPALRDAMDERVLDSDLPDRLGQAARQWVRSEFVVATIRDATLGLTRKLA